MLKLSFGTAVQKDTLGEARFASEEGWELSTHALMALMGTPATPARRIPGPVPGILCKGWGMMDDHPNPTPDHLGLPQPPLTHHPQAHNAWEMQQLYIHLLPVLFINRPLT